jgi:hypothetical protein
MYAGAQRATGRDFSSSRGHGIVFFALSSQLLGPKAAIVAGSMFGTAQTHRIPGGS